MYKVIWDKEINGVILTDKPTEINNLILPRPVFFEELDLLKFNKFWNCPRTKKPLLWANGRRYYCRGEWVAEAKGGNIFESPQINITENGKDLIIEPINVDLMVRKNQEALRVLENEAMDFVEHTYKSYKRGRNKVNCFAVSFSGGKDSQVVLDIVSRIIPPDEYIVVFTDTDMELPSTYENVEETKAYYQKLYAGLRFETAKGRLPSEKTWRIFGPPSRIHRWCCTVHKTAPYMSLINCMFNGKKQPKILTFEGVRAEESAKRESYTRISKGTKHTNQINAEVIRYWNSAEVFLYTFYRELKINEAYRYGLSRIGCGICPFGSEWSEYIINYKYSEVSSKYLGILKEYVDMIVPEKNKALEYICEGAWKKKPGWGGINSNGTKIDFFSSDQRLEALISNPNENFIEWSRTIGEIYFKKEDDKKYGEIKVRDKIFDFEVIKNKDDKILVKIGKINNDIIFKNKIERILYKATYCIHCGTCEVECPTGALKVSPYVKIDTTLCNHCGNCLYHAEKGCFKAQADKMILGGGKNMANKSGGFTKYKTFGLRREWLFSFLTDPDKWFSTKNLGPIQAYAVIVWLRDADVLKTKENKITRLGHKLKTVFFKNERLSWEIIWINLSHNSSLIKWYISDVDFGNSYSTGELVQLGLNRGFSGSKNTISSGIDALANMLETTPLGNELKLGIIEKRGNTRNIQKLGTDDVHPIAIAYSLYRYAESKNRRDLTISEFYRDEQKEGPYRLFGISKGKLENILRYLQENKNGILKADLIKGLDNIHLREDLNHIDVLELLSEEIYPESLEA
ncbi:MAG: phosphoadenosine phosphosulfate reductase family protein [Thermodesulfovibrionales bacterium]|nr:phosphoadenosine phosphosulfate reductase family protein [Thermodesulfovibrionales bacterium]